MKFIKKARFQLIDGQPVVNGKLVRDIPDWLRMTAFLYRGDHEWVISRYEVL